MGTVANQLIKKEAPFISLRDNYPTKFYLDLLTIFKF